MLEDQVRIEEKDGGFSILLVQCGTSHPMDHRKSLRDAKEYAIYLGLKVKLPVYYQSQKLG